MNFKQANHFCKNIFVFDEPKKAVENEITTTAKNIKYYFCDKPNRP